MSRARIYVQKNGQDVIDHPLHNRNWSGSGAYIGFVGAWPVRDRMTSLEYKGRDVEWTYHDAGEDQTAPVMVKVWIAGEVYEKFIYATREQVEAAGKKFVPVEDVAPYYERFEEYMADVAAGRRVKSARNGSRPVYPELVTA